MSRTKTSNLDKKNPDKENLYKENLEKGNQDKKLDQETETRKFWTRNP